MSISVMTAIWKTCLFQGNTLNVILAMGDFAEDDGGDIFPGIELLAAKCRASVRTTQNALRELGGMEVIEQIANARGGRGKVTEYRIDLERVQELQALHEAENPTCEHCQAKRKSAEKRAQHRAQRVQAGAVKGADRNQKGAEPRERIDNTHQDPPTTHQHSPADAGESGNIASLGKGRSERWPEFRSMLAKTWPAGFPAENEIACKAEFERQTRTHDPDLIIECAGLHGRAKTTQQDQRGKSAGKLIMKKPSNWLKEGEWQGYIPQADEARRQEARTVTALGNVRRALGDDLYDFLRRQGVHDLTIAVLDGVTLSPPAHFAITSPFQRTIIERVGGALDRHLGDRPSFTLVAARQTG